MDIEGGKADESIKVRHWKTILIPTHAHPHTDREEIPARRCNISSIFSSLSPCFSQHVYSTDNTNNTHM